MSLNVLDCGGGVGQLFPVLRVVLNNIGKRGSINYSVIESAGMCKRGREIYSGKPHGYARDGAQVEVTAANVISPTDRTEFFTDIGSYDKSPDIFISISTLQYLTELADIISFIQKRKPKYLFFSYISVNFAKETIRLAQSINGKCLPFVVAHDISSLRSIFYEAGYSEIAGAGNYGSAHEEMFSKAVRSRYPDVRMTDLFFTHKNQNE